jgi:hypothetical protein
VDKPSEPIHGPIESIQSPPPPLLAGPSDLASSHRISPAPPPPGPRLDLASLPLNPGSPRPRRHARGGRGGSCVAPARIRPRPHWIRALLARAAMPEKEEEAAASPPHRSSLAHAGSGGGGGCRRKGGRGGGGTPSWRVEAMEVPRATVLLAVEGEE